MDDNGNFLIFLLALCCTTSTWYAFQHGQFFIGIALSMASILAWVALAIPEE